MVLLRAVSSDNWLIGARSSFTKEEASMNEESKSQEKEIRYGPGGAKSEKILCGDGSHRWRLTGGGRSPSSHKTGTQCQDEEEEREEVTHIF